jgi:hypothetical protein
MSTTEEETTRLPQTAEELAVELNHRGHITTSWDEIGTITLAGTGAVTSQYRIGLPTEDASPTVFKTYFPPGCRIEAHTHPCDYSEIILEGRQKVTGKWLEAGDIRVGLANRAYGPLIAGDDGVTVLVIFANGNWPAIMLGKGDGSTLGTDELMDRFTSAS